MRAKAATREATREVLVFVLGGEEYAVDILKVQEIRGYDKVTVVPAAPPFLKGVTNLRGTIVPIIDLRIKLALAEARYDEFTVVVILRLQGRVVGAVVDAVSDVAQIVASDLKPAPQLGALVDQSYLEGIATPAGRMIMILDIEKFLSSGDLSLLDRVAETQAPA